MTAEGLTFRHYDAEHARTVADEVEDIYTHSYVRQIATGDSFRTPETFMRRFYAYTNRTDRGFEMIHAISDGAPVGQTWGWPLEDVPSSWAGLELDDASQSSDEFTAEDGRRTFALSELMVRAEYAGRGIASALHTELVRNRPEERATLLVAPDNHRAYDTYLHWGWYRVGTLRPSWPDAPTFDVLMLDLH